MGDPSAEEVLHKLLQQVPKPEFDDQLRSISQTFRPETTNVRLLADACRNDEWRLVLGNTGFLLRVLNSFQPDGDDIQLTLQTLRFVGNCCADTDENREVALKFLREISSCLQKTAVRDVAIGALFNVCTEYEPAQDAALKAQIYNQLAKHLSNDDTDTDSASAGLAVDLLGLLLLKLSKASAKEEGEGSFATDFVDSILSIPRKLPETDSYVDFMHAALPLFDQETFQSVIARDAPGLAESALKLYTHNIDRLDGEFPDEDPSWTQQVVSITDKLLAFMCDIAALREYGRIEDLEHDGLAAKLTDLAKDWTFPEEQKAAYQMQLVLLMFGNIARKDWISVYLVQNSKLHLPAIEACCKARDRQVKHAAAGFLRNVAVPKEAKQSFEGTCWIKAVFELISSDDIELRVVSLRLIRQLLKDGPILCEQFVLSPDSKAIFAEFAKVVSSQESVDGSSSSESKDALRLKLESARVVVTMYRTANIARESGQKVLEELDVNPSFVEAMVFLTMQNDEAIKSEGWMGLAMASKSKRAASSIYHALRKDDGMERLQSVLNPQRVETDRGDPVDFREKDKDNALVLIGQMVKNLDDELSPRQMDELKSLLSSQLNR